MIEIRFRGDILPVTMNTESTLRIMIAETQPLVRKGIRKALGVFCDIIVAAEACNGQEALELANRGRIDVALVDVCMPDRDGFRAIEELSGHIPCVALTASASVDELLQAMQSGASSVIMKNAKGPMIAAILRAAYRHETFNENIASNYVPV